jgi:hypothetical protein
MRVAVLLIVLVGASNVVWMWAYSIKPIPKTTCPQVDLNVKCTAWWFGDTSSNPYDLKQKVCKGSK